MGISIHFKGHIRAKESLSTLVEEVTDIAKIYQWPYRLFDTEFPSTIVAANDYNLYGISFTPPECETISLCFLPNGKLISIWSWRLFLERKGQAKKSLDGWISVKTHYAGEAVHKLIIHLLDHLNKKYFTDFTLSDEGQYWETRDEDLLHQKFNYLNGLMNSFAEGLEVNPKTPGESFDKYFQRILKNIHTPNKK